jgi:hypothetical protein
VGVFVAVYDDNIAEEWALQPAGRTQKMVFLNALQ